MAYHVEPQASMVTM